MPALDSLLPQLSQIPRPKVADCSDDLSVAGVLLCVDPPRVPDAAAVATVALQVLLDIARLVLEGETFCSANETYSR